MATANLTVKPKEIKQLSIIIALFMVYIFWGGTYLGIKIAIESVPPFIVAGVRSLTAGLILYVWARVNGAERPKMEHWIGTGIVGALLLLLGNGLVTWSEQLVPSGIASLLVATVPLWMVVLSSMGKHGKRPNPGVIAGIILGLVGIAVLVLSGGSSENKSINIFGVIALLIATFSWSIGSLYSRKAKLPDTPLLSTAMQMLVGGGLLVIASIMLGEWPKLEISQISTRSYLAMGYLIVCGSIMGYNAYIWLLKNAEPLWVSTYAFINPIVAVFLGWVFAGEELTLTSLIAAFIIITAVVVITVFRDQKSMGKTRSSLSNQ